MPPARARAGLRYFGSARHDQAGNEDLDDLVALIPGLAAHSYPTEILPPSSYAEGREDGLGRPYEGVGHRVHPQTPTLCNFVNRVKPSYISVRCRRHGQNAYGQP